MTNKINDWKYIGKGKGDTESKAISNSIKMFQSAGNGLNELSDSMAAYVKMELDSSCLLFIQKAEEATKVNDLAQALLILNNIKKGSGCSGFKKPLEEKITEMQGKEFCSAAIKK